MALYVLKPDFHREFYPQVILMIVLAILFFFGILLNITLMSWHLSIGAYLGIIIVILIVMIINTILVYKKALGKKYEFFKDRIVSGKKEIYLVDVEVIEMKRTFIDNMFQTGSIVLSSKFKVANITKYNQIHLYIQQLVQYARKQNFK